MLPFLDRKKQSMNPSMGRCLIVVPLEAPTRVGLPTSETIAEDIDPTYQVKVAVATDIAQGQYVFDDHTTMHYQHRDAHIVARGAVLLALGARTTDPEQGQCIYLIEKCYGGPRPCR